MTIKPYTMNYLKYEDEVARRKHITILCIFDCPEPYTFCIVIKISISNNIISISMVGNILYYISNLMYNTLFVYNPLTFMKLWFNLIGIIIHCFLCFC